MSDPFDVAKEVVLVTGASQGLGRHFARLLASRKAAVVLAARQINKLTELEHDIRNNGGQAVAVQMDVTDQESVVKAIQTAENALGPVTVLINNAGVVVEKAAVDQTGDDWDKVLNANLKGSFTVATEIGRRMIARRSGGSIINISSVLGLGVMGHVSTYSASKAALIQLTKSLALEWASKGIRVNALAPGYIDTEFNHDFWATPPGEKLIKKIPQRRLGQEADLDGAILLMASQASRYMTGSVITVDGGFLLG
ncbi:MAG: SDR family oxidoreductase [Proteobacteria bacterium]|nr:MAG: SDR family oxidoreductase [Pseudomonadota bacterium]